MNITDKEVVIFAVVIIVIGTLLAMGIDGKEIVANALTGLFGIAVGKALN